MEQWLKPESLALPRKTAILDDGGNLKAFSRMDGAPIPTIEMAQNKAYTALLGVSLPRIFSTLSRATRGFWPEFPRSRALRRGGGFPIKVNGELVGEIGVSGAPTVQNDIDCASAALVLVSDAVPVG